MNEIKAIIFDLGNVLLPFDPMKVAKRLSLHSPLPPEKILQVLWDSRTAEQFESGKMSDEAFYRHAENVCRFKIGYAEFISVFNDIFLPDGNVTALVPEFKKRYKLGLISNTNAIHACYVKEKYDFMKLFDVLVLSHEAGMRKPDATIYNMALERLKCLPGETVYIDDTQENVQAGINLGMHGIYYKSYDMLVNDLERIGVICHQQ